MDRMIICLKVRETLDLVGLRFRRKALSVDLHKYFAVLCYKRLYPLLAIH